MKYLLNLVLSLLVLTACSSTIPTTRYSLVEDVDSSSFKLSYQINLELTDSLKDGGVVLKTSEVSLQSANYHRWYGSLKDQLSILLNDSLIEHQVDKKIKFDVFVSKFYGSTSGDVFIDVTVNATKDKQIFTHRYTQNQKQSKDGYQALVECLKSNYEQICSTIAKDLVENLY